MKLKITSSQLIFAFKVDKDIRRKQFDYEDALSHLFKAPFRSNPFPDEIDPNIPRFEGESLNGYSKIAISQNRLTFITSYDDSYKDDIEKVKKYLEDRTKSFQLLLEKQEIEFVAYIIDLQCEMKSEEINDYLSAHINSNVFKNKKVKDFSLSYSFEQTKDFYLNVRNSKFSEFKLELIPGTNIFKPIEGEIRNGINVVLDLNSKLSFERGNKYSPELNSELHKLTFLVIQEKGLPDYLKGNI